MSFQTEIEILQNVLSEKNAEDALTVLEVVFAPRNRTVHFQNYETNIDTARVELADYLEKSAAQKTVQNEKNFSKIIQSSFKNLPSEPVYFQEYYCWLYNAAEIIKNMNDGYISQADFSTRQNFLTETYAREKEILVCLGLYDASGQANTSTKSAALIKKLIKLREMRTAVELVTLDEPEREVSKENYEKALPYYKYFKGLAKLPFPFDLNQEQKEEDLGINHFKDSDVQPDFKFKDALQNKVLDIIQNPSAYLKPDFDPNKYKNIIYISSKEFSDKVKDLALRRQTFCVKYALLEKPEKLLDNLKGEN